MVAACAVLLVAACGISKAMAEKRYDAVLLSPARWFSRA
jgi:hypothetical protein